MGGGLHGRQKRVKAQSESSKSVVNSVLISREMPVFPGFLEIIRVVDENFKLIKVETTLIADEVLPTEKVATPEETPEEPKTNDENKADVPDGDKKNETDDANKAPEVDEDKKEDSDESKDTSDEKKDETSDKGDADKDDSKDESGETGDDSKKDETGDVKDDTSDKEESDGGKGDASEKEESVSEEE